MITTQIFSTTTLRFVCNGFILLYQDNHNILNQDTLYDIISDRRKALIEFKVFENLYIVPPHCFLVAFHHPNNYQFPYCFKPKNPTIPLVSIKFGKIIHTF